MIFGSLFTGIGGFDLGLERAGMACQFQVETDAYCNRILERHWPQVPRFGDVRDCGAGNLSHVDLICGGFPCQDVSTAGKRKGLVGEQSGLWFEFERVLGELRPAWAVIENVPGLLTSHQGRDFSLILNALSEMGYGVAWRILDSRWFGVAQRRRRVFIVGHLGDLRAGEVLFEPKGGGRDIAEGGGQGQDVAHALTTRPGDRRQAEDTYVIAGADGTNQGSNQLGIRPASEGAYALDTWGGQGVAYQAEPTYSPYSVRRLTTSECEALQSFPQGWSCLCGCNPYSTLICQCPDSPRYRALGNAVTTNVAWWLGRRIVAQGERAAKRALEAPVP